GPGPQGRAAPPGNRGPASFAGVFSVLGGGGEAPKVAKGIPAGTADPPIDRQPPVREPSALQPLVSRPADRVEVLLMRVSRIGGADGGNRSDVAAIVFPDQRVSR